MLKNMADENESDFEPKPLIPVLGNTGNFPVYYANKNEVKVDYSRNVRIAGVIIVALIVLALAVIYLMMAGLL